MLVFFSGRRLKPGSYDQFRRAWMPEGEELPQETVAIYHARNVKDPVGTRNKTLRSYTR